MLVSNCVALSSVCCCCLLSVVCSLLSAVCCLLLLVLCACLQFIKTFLSLLHLHMLAAATVAYVAHTPRVSHTHLSRCVYLCVCVSKAVRVCLHTFHLTPWRAFNSFSRVDGNNSNSNNKKLFLYKKKTEKNAFFSKLCLLLSLGVLGWQGLAGRNSTLCCSSLSATFNAKLFKTRAHSKHITATPSSRN